MAKFKLEYIWNDRKRHLGLPLSFTKYAMTDDRFFMETGVFNIKSEEVLLYRVRDISLTRNFGQRIFGVGTIKLLSSDKTSPELVVKNVKHPMEVKELLHRNVEEMKIRRRVHLGELSGDFNLDDNDDFDDDDLS